MMTTTRTRGELSGKVAVVTGVTSGIGEALTGRLLAEGAQVTGLGRSSERLATVAARWGNDFMPVKVNLSSRPERQAVMEFLQAELPRVDIVVHNAAECIYATPLDLGADAWADLLEINLLAGIELVESLASALAPGGHVLNVSSVTARHLAHPRLGPYSLTRSAVERFTEGLRLELAPKGIKVSGIAPGLVDAPFHDRSAGLEAVQSTLRRLVPEWLSADDVADTMVWMLTRPAGVVVSEVVLLPRRQAS